MTTLYYRPAVGECHVRTFYIWTWVSTQLIFFELPEGRVPLIIAWDTNLVSKVLAISFVGLQFSLLGRSFEL